MKIKAKDKPKNANWHKVIVVWPKRTEDGYWVFLGRCWRKWRTHMASGEYIYRAEKP